MFTQAVNQGFLTLAAQSESPEVIKILTPVPAQGCWLSWVWVWGWGQVGVGGRVGGGGRGRLAVDFLFKFPRDFAVHPEWKTSGLNGSFQRVPYIIREEDLLSLSAPTPRWDVIHFSWSFQSLSSRGVFLLSVSCCHLANLDLSCLGPWKNVESLWRSESWSSIPLCPGVYCSQHSADNCKCNCDNEEKNRKFSLWFCCNLLHANFIREIAIEKPKLVSREMRARDD